MHPSLAPAFFQIPLQRLPVVGPPAAVLLGVIIRGNADVREIESGLAAGQLGQLERDKRIRSLGPVPGAPNLDDAFGRYQFHGDARYVIAAAGKPSQTRRISEVSGATDTPGPPGGQSRRARP